MVFRIEYFFQEQRLNPIGRNGKSLLMAALAVVRLHDCKGSFGGNIAKGTLEQTFHASQAGSFLLMKSLLSRIFSSLWNMNLELKDMGTPERLLMMSKLEYFWTILEI